ncbi:hypothetical protein RB916_001484 [Campylobacter jejuni]|nr:hypothetical protein [Campylobacter jejuni]
MENLKNCKLFLNLWNFEAIDLFCSNDFDIYTKITYYYKTGRFDWFLKEFDNNTHISEISNWLNQNIKLSITDFKNYILNVNQNLLYENDFIDPAVVANFYLNSVVDNKLEYNFNLICSFYLKSIHNNKDEIIVGYFISSLVKIIEKFDNLWDLIPRKPLDFTYMLMSKLYYLDSKASKKYYEYFAKKIGLFLNKDRNFLNKKQPKIAVCFFGILRGDWKKCLKENIENIVKPLNADCFLFSWDEVQLWPGLGGGGNWIARKCEREFADSFGRLADIHFLYENFNNVFFKLDCQYLNQINQEEVRSFCKELGVTELILESQQNFKSIANVAKMYYGIYKSYKIMEEYETKNHIEYDFVISLRVDVDMKLNDKEIDKFYSMHPFEISDHHISDGTGTGFAWGRKEAMKIYTSLYKELDNLQEHFITYKYDNHEIFFKWELYSGLINRYVNLIYIDILGSTNVASGYYFPDIKNELKMDIEKLENKFSKQEINLFIKSFSIVEKRFKPMSSNVKVFNKYTGLVSNNYKIPLSYIIGSKLIKSSKKSYFYLFKSLITLAYFSKKYKINPEYTTDYETLKKYKNSFSFKVGSQFINAHKNWYKGGYIKFIFKDIPRLKREFDNKKYKL